VSELTVQLWITDSEQVTKLIQRKHSRPSAFVSPEVLEIWSSGGGGGGANSLYDGYIYFE
jgi:hypothetical protein